MNANDPLDDRLREAFTSHDVGQPSRPPIEELVAARHQATRRRTLSLAAGVLVVAGAAGLVLAADDESAPQLAGVSTDDARGAVGSPIDDVLTGTNTAWRCTGLIGSDGVSWWFLDCSVEADVADISTTTTSLGTIVEDTTPTTTAPTTTAPAGDGVEPDPDAIPTSTVQVVQPVPASEGAAEYFYEIKEGDFPLAVAEAFGVSLDDLVAFNANDPATAAAMESFTPGSVIRIPPHDAVQLEYTLQFGDFPLGVASKFCVPLENLLVYNGIPYDLDDDGVLSVPEFPGPGSVLGIPPGGRSACAESVPTTTGP